MTSVFFCARPWETKNRRLGVNQLHFVWLVFLQTQETFICVIRVMRGRKKVFATVDASVLFGMILYYGSSELIIGKIEFI